MFEDLIRFGQQHEILIVNDNPYSLVLNPTPISILEVAGAEEVALELNSLSKGYHMAGWRLGMLAGADKYINAVLQVVSNMESGMFLPLQQAAIEALSTPLSWNKEQNDHYKRRRALCLTLLNTIGCTVEQGQVGMFVWAKIPMEAESAEVLAEQLLDEAEVFLTPGSVFGKNGERYLRLSLCSDEQTLETALERVKRHMADRVLVLSNSLFPKP